MASKERTGNKHYSYSKSVMNLLSDSLHREEEREREIMSVMIIIIFLSIMIHSCLLTPLSLSFFSPLFIPQFKLFDRKNWSLFANKMNRNENRTNNHFFFSFCGAINYISKCSFHSLSFWSKTDSTDLFSLSLSLSSLALSIISSFVDY